MYFYQVLERGGKGKRMKGVRGEARRGGDVKMEGCCCYAVGGDINLERGLKGWGRNEMNRRRIKRMTKNNME